MNRFAAIFTGIIACNATTPMSGEPAKPAEQSTSARSASAPPEPALNEQRKKPVSNLAPHPGTIRFVEVFAKSERDVHVEEVPERQRFVYLKDGVETANSSEATSRVPIIEVRMISVDASGNLVSKDVAAKLIIEEFGPDGRRLRHTTMLRNAP